MGIVKKTGMGTGSKMTGGQKQSGSKKSDAKDFFAKKKKKKLSKKSFRDGKENQFLKTMEGPRKKWGG